MNGKTSINLPCIYENPVW